MDWELKIYNSGSSPLLGKTSSQWIERDRGVELTKSFFNKGSFCDTVGSNPSPPMFSRLNGWAGNMFDSEDYE